MRTKLQLTSAIMFMTSHAFAVYIAWGVDWRLVFYMVAMFWIGAISVAVSLVARGVNVEALDSSDSYAGPGSGVKLLCGRKGCNNPPAYFGAVYCGAGCSARAEAGE